jgi:hypothetical protein
MATVSTTDELLADLKERLQALLPLALERVAAALISEHLGVGIAVAKSGFQHGADAGPAGRRGRRFRIETKRYADGTSLSDRELLGEVDDALGLDPALEAWFLVATRNASEQLEQKLLRKSDEVGVPILVIDWKVGEFPALAALCTASPSVLDSMVSTEAGDLARALTADAGPALLSLTRDMEAWNLGFARLRELSHARLRAIWEHPRVSQSDLGQDAAGGAHPHIRRVAVHASLDKWWSGRAGSDAPAVVMGFQGSGKTWASLHWLVERVDEQPIIILVPSKFASGLAGVSRTSIKRFLAERLYELTDTRDPEHWHRRLDRLLKRPSDEGPAITVVFDGMNEYVLAPWKDVLSVLQAPEFSGRVRVVAVTRNLHFTERLGRLASLVERPATMEVGPFDDAPGAELDQRLALEGLTRADLHEDLVDIARTPRLFSLVVRLRNRLVDGGVVTIHRLLWEYGRDPLAPGASAFGEREWLSWLAQVARNRMDGMEEYDLADIGSMIGRADLDEAEVFRRLSDIIDSELTSRHGSHAYQLSQTLVAHALGVALLDHLQRGFFDDREVIQRSLDDWLDPIAGFDEKAEILRAAISILLVDTADRGDILSPLVSAWLHSQNLPEGHRSEVLRLAQSLCDPLLDIVETSSGTPEALAIEALRSTRHADSRERVIARCAMWLSTISREVDPPDRRNEDQERSRSQRMMTRVGADADGERTILGRAITFVEQSRLEYGEAVAQLLEGGSLAEAVTVFELAALRVSITRRFSDWNSLKWVCLLNEVDFAETAAALRARSDALLTVTPEPGVAAWLPARVAALLLWLSGDEDLEALAVERDAGEARNFDYDADYLANPAESMFALERRHADPTLADYRLPLRRRIDRTKAFWTDFRFEPPSALVQEMRQAMQAFDVSTLDRGAYQTAHDHNFEDVSPALARAAPDLLAALHREKLAGLPQRSDEARAMAAVTSTELLLLVNDQVQQAARAVRVAPLGQVAQSESDVRSRMLLLELVDLSPLDRVEHILEAGLGSVYNDYEDLLLPLGKADVDALISRYRDAEEEIVSQLLMLLAIVSAPIGDASWDWIERRVTDREQEQSGIAMRLLYESDARRLGRKLTDAGWHWTGDPTLWLDHFGSLAVATATVGLPFDRIASSIAPWLLPRAVAMRGGAADDVDIATTILRHVVEAQAPEPTDPGSVVTVSDERRAADPASVSMMINYDPDDGSLEGLNAALDVDRRREIRDRAIETARERIEAARASGASLHMRDFRVQDMMPFVEHAPSAIDAWLDGMEEVTPDFQRRVRRSEGLFVALCEALLEREPVRGEVLWQALRRALLTKFVGAADIDKMIHMAFRVEVCPEAIRQRILAEAKTDRALFEVVLAASLHGRGDWLTDIAGVDVTSGVTWRLQRSRWIKAFDPAPPAIVPEWPVGQGGSLRVSRERAIDAWVRRGAFARHWWETYWSAPSDEEAYAAWVLLLKSVDRRGHAWMRVPDEAASMAPRRLAHFKVNRNELHKAMKTQEKNLDREFLGRRIISAIEPWRFS